MQTIDSLIPLTDLRITVIFFFISIVMSLAAFTFSHSTVVGVLNCTVVCGTSTVVCGRDQPEALHIILVMYTLSQAAASNSTVPGLATMSILLVLVTVIWVPLGFCHCTGYVLLSEGQSQVETGAYVCMNPKKFFYTRAW